MKTLVRFVRWLISQIYQDIEVRFYANKHWHRAQAWFGVYNAKWWAGPFKLLLTSDGKGIILNRDMRGTGNPYPGFQWRPAS